MSTETSGSTSPAPAGTTAAPAKGSMGFMGGLVIGAVIGLFVGAVALPYFEAKSGGGRVTNNPDPSRRMKAVSPAEREQMPSGAAVPEAEKPAEAPAAPAGGGGGGGQ